MKHVSSRLPLTLVFILAFAFVCLAGPSQDKAEPKVPEEEAKAAAAIETAADAPAKLAAATAFATKYPKSTLRPKVAQHVAYQISILQDNAQKVRLAEELQKAFAGPGEVTIVRRVVIDAYASADRLDEAFALATTALTATPEDVWLLTRMAGAGTDAAKKQNGKFVTTSLQYGTKAIGLIEANKKPADLDEATWTAQKNMLPRLYQDMGILSFISKNHADAQAKFEKAATLVPDDPMNYAMIATIYDDQYQQSAEAYKAMPAGAQRDEMMKKITQQLDMAIENYARAIGVATGRPEYQPLMNQAIQNLTPYYKFRHNNSTDGMQALIDKYKPAPKP